MIIQEIKDRLEKHSNPEKARRKRVHWRKLYQEMPKLYGVPTPVVRKLSSEFFLKVKKKPKHEILQLCNDLLTSGYSEERTIAFDWAFRLRKVYEKADFRLLETWLMKHVHGWGACDDLCTHALGAFIYQFPQFVKKTREWTRSENRWVRRASAVCLIYSVRRKEHLSDVFETADALLTDQDVMVQKGYGWMLKEASNNYPKEVFDYVMKNRRDMPRTALRYAIEKLSPKHRVEAMKRE
jgi:3-methyladenine DNA glycosylase AlkD